MAASSKHKYDVARWIEQVINSCKTPIQIVSARQLISNYGKMYSGTYSVVADLWLMAKVKENELKS